MDREPEPPLSPSPAGSPAEPASTECAVAVFFDLATRDGRRSVEIRAVTDLADAHYASPRATLYSCAYATQAERILALRRARIFCDEHGHRIVHFARAEDRRAAWQ